MRCRTGSYDFRVRVGVLNLGTATLRSVEVFVVSLAPGFNGKRSLPWVGHKVGEPIDLKPSQDHHHVEVFNSYFDASQTGEQSSLAIGGGWELDDQAYEAVLSVEADDVPALRVAMRINPSTKPWVVVHTT